MLQEDDYDEYGDILMEKKRDHYRYWIVIPLHLLIWLLMNFMQYNGQNYFRKYFDNFLIGLVLSENFSQCPN